MNRAELKANAKLQIRGKIGILFVISLVIFAITLVSELILSLIPIVGSLLASIIVTPAFALSTVCVYQIVIKGETPEIKDAFSGFDDFWSAFKVVFLVGLFTYLWTLLFIIPGIIKSISYSMSLYILAENKGKGALECINESKAMTEGHKMDLFVLSLSFLGWILLGILTLGIAFIWIIPYMNATYMNAYNSLKPAIETQETVEEIVAEPVAENQPETNE